MKISWIFIRSFLNDFRSERMKSEAQRNAMHMIEKEKFTAQCEDGVALKGLLIIPPNPKAVVQFNAGTAAKKEFYLPFLEFLAENGYLCALWDYRGSGESAPPKMGKCDYSMIDYGLKDLPAVKGYLRARYPELPFLLFGHSVGGQMVGFLPGLDEVTGMLGFAISTGYTSNMPLGYRMKSIFFFYMFSPLSILFTGFVNAARFGFMEDLPRNVVRQWRKWCARKDYFFSEDVYGKSIPKGQFENIPFPIHIFWTTDDPISNRRNVPAFWSHITSKKEITFDRFEPSEAGMKTVGHFGFFNKKARGTMWPKALAKLDGML